MKNSLKRKIQTTLYKSSKIIHYKIGRLSLWEKVILWGLWFCVTSFFLPWIIILWDSGTILISWLHPFWLVLGRVWYLLSWIIVFMTVIIFKNNSSSISDYLIKNTLSKIFIFSGLALLLLSLQTLLFVQWIQVFSSEILYGNGIILSLTGSIITIVGWSIVRYEKRQKSESDCIRNSEKSKVFTPRGEKKDNMKLPF